MFRCVGLSLLLGQLLHLDDELETLVRAVFPVELPKNAEEFADDILLDVPRGALKELEREAVRRFGQGLDSRAPERAAVSVEFDLEGCDASLENERECRHDALSGLDQTGTLHNLSNLFVIGATHDKRSIGAT